MVGAILLALLWRSYNLAAPYLNDYVAHVTDTEYARDSILAGSAWSDFWAPHIELGYPIFHHYQHGGQFIAALLATATGADVEPLMRWLSFLLVASFPTSVYLGGRLLGMSRLAAGVAASLAPWLSTGGLFGMGFDSYLWRSWGLYTQIWGMWLLPLTWAVTYRAVAGGSKVQSSKFPTPLPNASGPMPSALCPLPYAYGVSTLLLTATWLSHLVYGYMCFLNLGLYTLVDGLGRFPRRLARVVALVLATVVTGSYFFLWLLRDASFGQVSQWEKPEKYLSYGALTVIKLLFQGELFDHGRYPIVTALALLGLLVALRRWHQPLYCLLAALFVGWVLLYFGRATWGNLMLLLPGVGDLPLHRFIAGVQMSGLLLAGEAVAWAWLRWGIRGRLAGPRLAALLPVLLALVAWEPASYAATDATWIRDQRAADAASDGQDLQRALDFIAAQPPGRVYAGLPAGWGGSYKVGQVPVFAFLAQRRLDSLGFLYQLSFNPDIQLYFDENRLEDYNVFNVRYALAPAEFAAPPFLTLEAEFGRHRVYRAPTSGYFEVVRADVGFHGTAAQLVKASAQWLASPLPQRRQHPRVYLDEMAGGLIQPTPKPPAGDGWVGQLSGAKLVFQDREVGAQPPAGALSAERVAPGRYGVKVELPEPAYVMLKATYHPGWQVTLDGVQAPTELLLPKYVGVLVGPGQHQLELRYQASPWRPILAGAGLVLLLGIFIMEIQRRQERPHA